MNTRGGAKEAKGEGSEAFYSKEEKHASEECLVHDNKKEINRKGTNTAETVIRKRTLISTLVNTACTHPRR